MTDRIDTAQERRRLVGNEAVLHRIPSYLDAIDAERARAEKAEDERTQALARLAVVKRETKCPRCGSDGGFGCYECIPPAAAEAALQRVVDATWDEAVEKCAAVLIDLGHVSESGETLAKELRAIKRSKEASHE